MTIHIAEEINGEVVSTITAKAPADAKHYCTDTPEPTATIEFISKNGSKIYITMDYRTLTELKYEADKTHVTEVAPF